MRGRTSVRGAYVTTCAWALLLFGMARTFRSDQLGPAIDRQALSVSGLHNVATLLGMSVGTAGAIPLLCIGAIITGGTPPGRVAITVAGVFISVGMTTTFAMTSLSEIPSTFISRDIPISGGVALYWVLFLIPIATAALYIAFNAGRLLRWTAPGPWRVLLLAVAAGGCFGTLYAAHKVTVLLATLLNTGADAGPLLRTAPDVTLTLGFLAIGGFALALLIWLLERLPRQVRSYRAVRLHHRAWVEARSATDRYLLEPQRMVPATRRAAWNASRGLVTERQMHVEIADSAFLSGSSRVD